MDPLKKSLQWAIFFFMATSSSEPSYTCVLTNGAKKVCI